MLQPRDPTVREARLGGKRLPAGRKPPPPRPTPPRRKSWPRTAVFTLLILLLIGLSVGGAVYLVQTALGDQAPLTDTVAIARPTDVVPTAIVANLQPLAPATPGPPSANNPPHSMAKAIAPTGQDECNTAVLDRHAHAHHTPTPTPTLVPTFISPPKPASWHTAVRRQRHRPLDRCQPQHPNPQCLRRQRRGLHHLISSGVANFPTVTGMFRIYLRYESQTMNGYLLGYDYYLENVPYVMYFYQDYALHGAYWHETSAIPHEPRLCQSDEPDAAWLYEWTTYGTVVNVHF
ncbi:MAG: L,D-transpeptidase [Chloroflexi bacterium]|nr:L,D-transpeptidase [Chloroflexota bacterium]